MGVISVNPVSLGLQDENQLNALNTQKQAAELAKNPNAIVTRYNPNMSGETEQEYLKNIVFGQGGDLVRDWNATNDADVVNGPIQNAKIAALGVADAFTLNAASGVIGALGDKYTKDKIRSMRDTSMHDIAGAITYATPIGLELAGTKGLASGVGALLSPGSKLLEKSGLGIASKMATIGAIDAAAATTGNVISEHILYGDLGVESASTDLYKILVGSGAGGVLGGGLGLAAKGLGRVFSKRPEIGIDNSTPVGMDGIADTNAYNAAQRQTEKFKALVNSEGLQPLSDPIAVGAYDIPRYSPNDQIRANLEFAQKMVSNVDEAVELARIQKSLGAEVPTNQKELDLSKTLINQFQSPEGKRQLLETGEMSAEELHEIAKWNLRGEQTAGTPLFQNKVARKITNDVLAPTNDVLKTVTKGLASDQKAFEESSLKSLDSSMDSSSHLQSTINSMDALEQAQIKIAEVLPQVEKIKDASTSDFAKETQRIEALRQSNKSANGTVSLMKQISGKIEVALYDLQNGNGLASTAYKELDAVRQFANKSSAAILQKSKTTGLTNQDKQVLDSVNEIIKNTLGSAENFGEAGVNNIKQMQARSKIFDINERFNKYTLGKSNQKDKIITKGVADKIKQSGPQTGSEGLIDNGKVITGFYSEYKAALQELENVYSPGKYQEQIQLLDQLSSQYSDYSNMLYAKKYTGSDLWRKTLEKARGEGSGERHISNDIRAVSALKDFESGDPSDAKRQLMRIMIDVVSKPIKKVYRAMAHEDSIESILDDKKQNIIDIQKSTNSMFEKISRFADRLLTNAKPTATVVMSVIPRTIGAYSSEKEFKETDKEFREKYARLKYMQENPSEIVNKIQNANSNLSDINPMYTGKIVNRLNMCINQVAGQLPELGSMYQQDFTMMQKTKFLDVLDMYTDPDRTFSQMIAGTASPEISSQVKMLYPNMYQKTSEYVRNKIVEMQKHSSEIPVSLFNYIGEMSPSMVNNYSQLNLPKQESMDQSAQQSINASAPRGSIKPSKLKITNTAPYNPGSI